MLSKCVKVYISGNRELMFEETEIDFFSVNRDLLPFLLILCESVLILIPRQPDHCQLWKIE